MTRKLAIEVASFLFILLFLYAALNKIVDFQKFKAQIGQSPLLTGFGEIVPWMVIGAELVISALLIVPKFRWIAFLLSFGLMVMFSEYIIAILTFSSYIPCSCGGVLENMGWREHLVFNLAFVGLALLAFVLQSKEQRIPIRA